MTRLNTYSTEQVTDIPKDVLEKAVEANVGDVWKSERRKRGRV